ncbi:hypothetical protein AQUCO_01600176v1 [Aquilegia coerulea]|nr:hypothetical protein AQUCO_01600176v1 [Aquilegia coerulea]
MEKPVASCCWTLVIQLSLCFALFIAFYIGGESERSNLNNKNTMRTIGSPLDLYFLSVRGGFRPLKLQTHLLKQMEKVAKAYDVEFVVDISELGENDPLMQNGAMHFPSLNVPWYTTNALQVQGKRYIINNILLQHGKTLDLIVVDTASLGGYVPKGKSRNNESDHLHWLTRTLEKTDSDWRIVVGYDPILICNKNGDKKGIKIEYESLYRVFTKFGVNAYLSKQPCTNLYLREGSIAHIGNLGPADEPYYSSESSIITR